MNPFHDLNFVIDACDGVTDQHNEICLKKILLSCEVHFFGFNEEHYELKCNRLDKPYAIRYK